MNDIWVPRWAMRVIIICLFISTGMSAYSMISYRSIKSQLIKTRVDRDICELYVNMLKLEHLKRLVPPPQNKNKDESI